MAKPFRGGAVGTVRRTGRAHCSCAETTLEKRKSFGLKREEEWIYRTHKQWTVPFDLVNIFEWMKK